MLNKTRLIKKDAAEQTSTISLQSQSAAEKGDRAQLTEFITHTTREWITSRRRQQSNPRQAFAALFANSEASSN